MKWMTAAILKHIDIISVRTEKDRRRFIALGASPGKVKLTGNIKHDTLLCDETELGKRAEFGIMQETTVITCGSTHSGEEEIIIKAVSGLTGGKYLCVIAPRHVERIPEIVKLLKRTGNKYSLFSEGGRAGPDDRYFIIDVFGILPRMYNIADICFVGGSLVPHGGQNFIEAVGMKKPVCVGPFNNNFHQEYDILKDDLFVAQNGSELRDVFMKMISMPEKSAEQACKAYEKLGKLTGALDKNVRNIEKLFQNG